MINSDGSDLTLWQIREALLEAELVNVPLKDLKAAAIRNALRECDGDRHCAAKFLGISTEDLAYRLDH